jgi:hypothetical protein
MAILSALAIFILAVLLHGLVMRVPMRMDSVRRFLLVGAPLGLALVVFALSRFGFTLVGFAAILLYALLCELYRFCFTLVISSVSVTMLIMLRQGPIENAKLALAYDPHEMVQLRVGRLIKTGFVERADGKLGVSFKGAQLHRMFAILRRFFGHLPN